MRLMILVAMFNELDAHKLEVELAPLSPRLPGFNEGGCKRVVTNKPPRWYRELCNAYPSSRGVRRGKFDTRIRRANILSILRRLSEGRDSCSKYVTDLLAIAQERGRRGV